MTRVDTAGMVAGLQRLIKQPSISSTGEGIEECAALVAEMLEDIGIQSRILTVSGHAPLVYGHLSSGGDNTVLFYNHYDVQPAEPLEMWKYPPFGGTVENGRVYGRGSADDKGELVSRMEAVRTLSESGDLSCDVKFVIEGEEENGSLGIPAYLDKYGGMMACDGVVWEFGYVDESDRPVIGLGMKGMMYVEMTARGPGRDLHSGTAPLVQNAAWRLVGALSTLATDDGRIRIPGWYAEAQPISEEEAGAIRRMPYDADSVKRDLGIERFVRNQNAQQAKKDLAGIATCNIAGIWSGYTGDGTKTVLPSRASAKLDLRLVSGMDPQVQWRRLQDHLRRHGYGDVEIRLIHAEPGIRTSPDHPFVRAVRNAADGAYGTHVLSVTYPETGPIWHFSTKLHAPCILAGGTPMRTPLHAPNEYARIDYMEKTAKMIIGLLNRPSV